MPRSFAIALVAVLSACSSHYFPRTRGRVATTMIDGQLAYVRDGRAYPHGFLGGGLVDVVAGDPAAEAAAQEYHSRLVNGLVMVGIGTAAMVGGTVVAAANSVNAPPNDPLPRSVTTPLLVALGGLVLELVGVGYAISAEPYRWDAINLFNDDAELHPTLHPPGYAATRARPSLRMGD